MIPILLFALQVDAKVKVKKLLITTQQQSWIEQKEITKKFTAKGLFEIINGGAVEYLNQGLVEGIHQQFSNNDGKTIEVFVEDFGNSEKSTNMLSSKKESFPDAGQLTGVSDVNAFSSKAIGALIVVGSLQNFYIELTISGFNDQSEMEKVAISFLDYYKLQLK
jgi:VIT1/CCC1 family predicted Fe2+/Mn2+ transporter